MISHGFQAEPAPTLMIYISTGEDEGSRLKHLKLKIIQNNVNQVIQSDLFIPDRWRSPTTI